MTVVLSFAAIIGVPFFAAVLLDALGMRRLFRAILIASLPAITAFLLYVPTYSSPTWG